MKFQTSILEYLGKLDDGVIILVSIIYENEYYEGTYFYTNDKIVFTVSEELENKIGHKITDDDEYKDLILSIIKKAVPYREIYNRIDNIDFRRWIIPDENKKNNE